MAEFHIKHSLYALPSNLYLTSDKYIHPSLITAHLAIEVYIKDIIVMVTSDVKGYVEEKE